jgi:transposase
MDAIETLKQDVQEGRIGVDRLVDLVVTQQRQIQAAQQQLQAAQQQLQTANQRIEELEKKLGGAATAKVDEPFSMRAEQERQEARGKKKRSRLFYARGGTV